MWQKLEASQTGMTLPQLVSELVPQFAVSVEELTTDLEHYLRELAEKELIRSTGQNPPFVRTSGRGML